MSLLNAPVGGKRTLQFEPITETAPIARLTDEIVYNIFINFLSHNDLLNFDWAIKSNKMRPFDIKQIWIHYKKIYNLDYKWAYCQPHEPNPKWKVEDVPKLEFRLGNALSRYVRLYESYVHHRIPDPKENIQKNFFDIAEYFPVLNAILWASPYDGDTFVDLTSVLSPDEVETYKRMCAKGYSGEKFLAALVLACSGLNINETQKQAYEEIKQLLLDSINDYSTLGSYQGWIFDFEDGPRKELAIKAAKHGDETELKRWLVMECDEEMNDKFAQSVYDAGHRFYSVCIHLGGAAVTSQEYFKADAYFSEALKINDNVSPGVATQIGDVKLNLMEYKEADKYYTIALKCAVEATNPILFRNAALVKDALEDKVAANYLNTKAAIKAAICGDETELKKRLTLDSDNEVNDKFAQSVYDAGHRFYSVCMYLATIAFQSKDYFKANTYFNEALKINDNVSPEVAMKIGDVKLDQKEYQAADKYYTIALQCVLQAANSILLKNAGVVKAALGDKAAAKSLYTKSLVAYFDVFL